MTSGRRTTVWAVACAAVVATTAAVWLAVGARGPDVGGQPGVIQGNEGWTRQGVADEVDTALGRAMAASRDLPHGGAYTVVSLGEDGPRIARMRVTRDADALHVARDRDDAGRWELGRVDGEAFLRSSDALLRLGGVEPPSAQLDRLRDKYQARLGDPVVIDTGPAQVLHLVERHTGVPRENLYLDDDTGLVVRRETFGRDGAPVRLVAYTELDAGPITIETPGGEGVDVRDHVLAAVDSEDASIGGDTVPGELPGGYELLGSATVDSATPALHLFYGDGLYSLSLFVQDGRMASAAVQGASELTTPGGGSVWRWPGSEPRRVVWTGEGRTFTVLSDAPTDELLQVIAGLPVDPPPSTLERLHRGITRVGDWLTPGDGSDP